jgi:hypothetical protein
LRSAGIFAMTFFWIDGHDMRIIEVDGVRVFSDVSLRAVTRTEYR